MTVSLVSLFSITVPYPGGFDFWKTEFTFAQLTSNNIIQITSTSSFIDDFGNFHVIGEVNNTSPQPQSNIAITAILSDTSNNLLVGNHSAFSSISNLRQGELSPFDIVIQDPQILGKFNFMEFSTTSQPVIEEKPANLVLNGSSSFVDNIGDPHITGNIINQGQSPEQFLNLVATFYDNSSLGIVGTESFGLNVGGLENNQMAPFDISITDNKTKSQAAFYSINVDSAQSSMGFPLNPKFPFAPLGGFVDSGLFLDSPLNVNPLPATANDFASNNNNNNDNDGSGSNDGDSDSSSSTQDLDIEIDISTDPIVRGNVQKITVEVSDDDTNEKISNANVNGEVEYASGSTDNGGRFDKDTDSNGEATNSWRISGNAIPGTFEVTVDVNAPGYDTETEETIFQVIEKSEDTNETSSQNNSTTDTENNNSTLANDDQNESNDDLDCEDIGDTNVPVGDDDPNNIDGDNDGVGCESEDGGDSGQSNNDEEGEGTTNEPSDTNPEQTDGDGDGVSNEQLTEEDTNSNGDSENEEQDTTNNKGDENSEDQDNDTGS
ncbi:hypothetical protein [Candidatus Nitrosocosmicus hydrocola]|uniref:hypothetical protein n=1 Tax=Candidatus Nitrosocosmicus hydrocola TaxID=1826872 RepID=UPI0011E5ED7E|nr:hypothetical protein [Candidatus Nitrosocosmicus hydrocola]